MRRKDDANSDAASFAKLLRETRLKKYLTFGRFLLKGKHGVKDKIQYNLDGLDLLQNHHEYTFRIMDGDLQVSLQLYENANNHFRLFCYTRINGKQGMTFSVNLTTEKESANIIYLTQKIKFSEQFKGNAKLAQAHRQQKQIVFCGLLRKMGLEITDTNDLILGIFDPMESRFLNTSAEKFLNDFIMVSIIKGHFQGNKGYQLEILPDYRSHQHQFIGVDDSIQSLPLKLVDNKSKRHIPLGLRYKVLKNNAFKCVACGHGVDDGAKLHIDHKLPFSLGGLTELNNLQTLCSECNLSKSNKHID